MASQILSSRVLGPLLPSDWKDRLVDTVLARISFSHYTPAEIALCEKYQNRAGLSAETRTVIAGLLAMSGGHLNQELASDLRDYFRNFSKQRQGAYQAEMKAFVSGFLPNCDSPESHRSLFTACCSGDFDEGEVFWLPYWEALKGELTNAFTARQALRLLSFWFGMKPEDLPEYILSYFFLDFPHVVEEVRKTRGFQDVVREMHERAAKQRLRWYPLLSDLFGGRKNILVSVGQSVGQGFKRLVAQGDEEAQQRAQIEAQKFEDSVAQLFEGKRLSDTQRQKFPTVYSFEQRERFWESYWEKFVKLVAHDAQQALDLLSFWFDESFTVWTQTPYAAESFFLGLQDALQVARKERGFQETARQINAKVRQRSSAYRWFPLIGDYFKVQESRIPWKR